MGLVKLNEKRPLTSGSVFLQTGRALLVESRSFWQVLSRGVYARTSSEGRMDFSVVFSQQ